MQLAFMASLTGLPLEGLRYKECWVPVVNGFWRKRDKSGESPARSRRCQAAGLVVSFAASQNARRVCSTRIDF